MKFVYTLLFLSSLGVLKADVVNGDFSITKDPEVSKKVYHIGDLVQIDIMESSESSYKEKAKGGKSTEFNLKLAKWMRLSRERTHRGPNSDSRHITRLKPAALNEPEIDVESEQDFENSSSDTRSSTFKEKLMCMVKDIRPNGNVFVEGIKEIRDGDKYRKMIFSGEISKSDLEDLTAIPSYRVYQPNIEIIETGSHKDVVKKTWLQRFLHMIWPF
jgi:flagellar basal body L-ring protein FlgH